MADFPPVGGSQPPLEPQDPGGTNGLTGAPKSPPTPPRGDTVTHDNPDGNNATLPDIASPEAGVHVDITDILKIFHELTESMRTSERAERQVSRDTELREIDKQIDAIKSQAVFSLVSGLVGGVSQIVSAGVTGIGAYKSANALESAKAPEAELNEKIADLEIRTETAQQWVEADSTNPLASDSDKAASKADLRQAEADLKALTTEKANLQRNTDAAIRSAEVTGRKLDAWSKAVSGAGEMIGAGLGYGAKTEEGEQQAAIEKQKKASFETQDHDEWQQKCAEIMADVRQMLRDIQSGENDVTRRILQA